MRGTEAATIQVYSYLELLQLSVLLFSLLLIVTQYCCETILLNLQITGVKKFNTTVI